ncbi:MAG: hypothetical protein KGJ62_02690 [Armatimonadetes bacterium]|nr:hypothetical protein [Armatimonadota bacterium]MDE2205273.1 hypothetical protein [Armatimonadota bacterium]
MSTGSNRAGNGKPAFTLLEVLVALIVLLVGILALLRLFPGGFLTIQNTAQLTSAQALARQQLDQQKSTLSAADAIVPGYFENTGGALPSLVINPNIQPDDLTDFDSVPGNAAAGTTVYDISNINRIRTVLNEHLRIPIPSPNSESGKYGAAYVLSMGPVYNQFALSNTGGPQDLITVRGMPLQRIETSESVPLGTPDTSLNLRNESQYAVDYNRDSIAFYPRLASASPVTTFRKFVITYDYYRRNTAGNAITETAVSGPATTLIVPDVDPTTIPAGTSPMPTWIPIFNNAANTYPDSATLPVPSSRFLGIRRGSEDVSRGFVLMSSVPYIGSAAPPAWTSDPYEYAWYSKQEPNNANLGVLLFNPAGHSDLENGPYGPQPLMARITYTTFDNHIIRDDRAVPSAAPYAIKLSLPLVLTNGDTLDDGTLETGMFRDPVAGDPPTPDVILMNANTGEEIGEYTNGAAVTGGGTPNFIPFTLDAKAGIVRLDPTAAANLQGVPLRILYRAQNDWGAQLQKATSQYTVMDPTAFTAGSYSLPYNNCYIGGSVAAGVGDPTKIYFPICDAGKSVSIAHLWVVEVIGGVTQVVDLQGLQYQINAEPGLFVSVQSGPPLTWIDLTAVNPNIVRFVPATNGITNGRTASGVMGISMKSRVVWKSAERWRKVDNDTVLATGSPYQP